MKIKKKIGGGVGSGGRGVRVGGGQSGCEWRSGEAFVKNKKKNFFFFFFFLGGGGEVRVDGNGELKLL